MKSRLFYLIFGLSIFFTSCKKYITERNFVGQWQYLTDIDSNGVRKAIWNPGSIVCQLEKYEGTDNTYLFTISFIYCLSPFIVRDRCKILNHSLILF